MPNALLFHGQMTHIDHNKDICLLNFQFQCEVDGLFCLFFFCSPFRCATLSAILPAFYICISLSVCLVSVYVCVCVWNSVSVLFFSFRFVYFFFIFTYGVLVFLCVHSGNVSNEVPFPFRLNSITFDFSCVLYACTIERTEYTYLLCE